ncbi:hypothetical protein GCM10009760_52960 [Kitasatospora kazusensis]|uniref:TPR repeat protein n=1 Tax=Kitasatospora kazusensis TaxID=407974 RepID=A0ABP5LUI5_9ACTN
MLPDYIERDHDRQLRAHLVTAACGGQTALVVVRGESCTGKTRTAFEAVRACLPDWQLVFPKTATRLLALLDADTLAPRTILWLNEAQNFLIGTDAAEAAAALHSRLEEAGPVVIVCTLWPEYYRLLTETPQPGRDAHAKARLLLSQARLIHVPGSFASEDLENPRVRRDRSLATALSTSTGRRITQTLAAGPQLVDHYERATGPYGPYAHAVITAAMDARRLGHTSPLPAALLMAAAPGYLTAQQRAAADPGTWFTHALEYARESVRGVAASLEPVANTDGMGAVPDIYRLSDYLDHHARTVRRHDVPPDSFWTAAQGHAATASDRNALARAAHQRARYRIAAYLCQRSADAGEVEALMLLAQWRDEAGDREGAADLYQRAADAGEVEALGVLARWREWAGDAVGAERLAQRAADAGDPRALTDLAQWRGSAGDRQGAERLAQRAADAGEVEALITLALWRTQVGDREGAERFAQRAADAGDPRALTDLARSREWAGDAAGAERLAQRAADAGEVEALTLLAQWRDKAGDREGATDLFQRAVDAGDPRALTFLARLREEAGDAEGAERLAQRAADAGDLWALTELARLREEAGDAVGAERLAQRVADAGDPQALIDLMRWRQEAGDTVGAERVAQRATDTGYLWALAWLANRRYEAGDREGAADLYQRGAAAGDTELALIWLAYQRKDAGDMEGAERLALRAVDAGEAEALITLAEWRQEAGDVEGAEGLQRFGLEADGSPAQPWWQRTNGWRYTKINLTIP